MRIVLLVSKLFALLFQLSPVVQPSAISNPVKFFIVDNKLANIDFRIEVDKYVLVRMIRDFDFDDLE